MDLSRAPRSVSGGGCLASEEVVDAEQDERADERGNEARPLAGAIPADGLADPSCEQCACDAEQHGDDNAAWILARHDELGQSTDDEPDDCLPQQMKHAPPNGYARHAGRGKFVVRSIVSLLQEFR